MLTPGRYVGAEDVEDGDKAFAEKMQRLPFADELFGCWFARMAARYRMGVDELARIAGIDLAFESNCAGWLRVRAPTGAI